MEDLENILSEVTQKQRNTWYVFADKWIFALKFTRSLIQPTDIMELLRKGAHRMAPSVLH